MHRRYNELQRGPEPAAVEGEGTGMGMMMQGMTVSQDLGFGAREENI